MNNEFKDDVEQSAMLRQKPTMMGGTTTTTAMRPRSSEPPNPQDLDAALCLLSKTKISERRPRSNTGTIEVTKENSTIVAKCTDTLSTIMEICSVESILGMGVIDPSMDNRCCGMIDVPDIARYLIFNCLKDCTVDNLSTHLTADCCRKVQDCMNTTTVMEVIRWLEENHQCPLLNCDDVNKKAVSPGIHVNPFCSSMVIPDGHSLLFGMEMMCHTGVKRLVTVDQQQRCTGFYSTSMAISDIRQQAHLLRGFTQCTVEQCLNICRNADPRCDNNNNNNLNTNEDRLMQDNTGVNNNNNMSSSVCNYNVTSLPITATAYEAFRLMMKENITGIALLDTHGKLTGTISIRDLRGLGKKFEHLDRLSLSLKDFKSLTLREYPQIAPPTHWASDSKTPQGCRFVELERGTMRDVLLALNDGNLNRVMIMSNESELVGIITLHDVIRCLLVCLGVLEC